MFALGQDYPAAVQRLREQFQPGGNRLQALYLLRLMEDTYTIAVISEVVDCYLSEGSRLEAFQTLCMLRHSDLEQHVPRAVWQLLDYEPRDGDYDELEYRYEWSASLLDDLGLTAALQELAQRALASTDPKSRSVGEWVRNELLPKPRPGQ